MIYVNDEEYKGQGTNGELYRMEIICNAEDIENLPNINSSGKAANVGSTAFDTDRSRMYMLTTDNRWVWWNATEYTVTFIDDDGLTVLKTEKVQEGRDATPPEGDYEWDEDYTNIMADTTITAV